MEFNPKQETKKIIDFIQKVLDKTKHEKVVIGLSGGIDSAVSFYLLKEVLEPKNIIIASLPYLRDISNEIKHIIEGTKIPKENINIISIKKIVDDLSNQLEIRVNQDKIRVANIMARIRMITLYDLAKKENALVCGTENKSEHLLGYFTRFGDEASDFEPILHLYKTQVYQLASYLNISKLIIEKKPTADLWVGQTDENELGFSYKEADQVLDLYFEKKQKIEEIKNKGFINAEKIIDRALKNKFKHEVPYSLL